MDTISCMNVSKSEAHLDEHVQDCFFIKEIICSTLCLFVYLITKVAIICVFHDDTQLTLFGSIDLIIFNNIRMVVELE